MQRHLIGKGLAVAGACALTAACGLDNRTFEGLRVTRTDQPRLGQTVRLLDACPSQITGEIEAIGPAREKAAAALVGVVAGVVADFVVSAAGQALKEAEEGRSGQFLALGTHVGAETVVAKDPQGPGRTTPCLLIYRGLFGPLGVADDASNGKLDASRLKALGLADFPAFYMEIEKSELSVDGKPVTMLAPSYIHYAESSAKYSGSGRKNVTVALALGPKAQDAVESDKGGDAASAGAGGGKARATTQEARPEADAKPRPEARSDEAAPLVFRFNLGRLAIGSAYAGSAKEPYLIDLRAMQPGKIEAGSPIAALVTETEEPSLALTALTEAFTKNKDSIGKAIGDAIKKRLED